MVGSFDWQFVVVLVAFVVAGAYVLRRFLAQFEHSEDEPAACRGCPATKAVAAAPRRPAS